MTDQIPHLRRYAAALVGDRAHADDLVQDCLERALSRSHLWREGNLRGWLFTIMHNIHANVRRRAARSPLTFAVDVEGVGAAARPSQEDGLQMAGLGAALRMLPEEQRAVILLIGLEEFSYAETAEVLGIPIGTVMSRLHRGRERLRQILVSDSGPSLRRVK
ncbi:MAG TPA: sigma-70 family RNA polymerase sigma factor [Dongiaceae bacterium]